MRATDSAARLGGDEFACILTRVAGRSPVELLIRHADAAMYSAKRKGGGLALFYKHSR